MTTFKTGDKVICEHISRTGKVISETPHVVTKVTATRITTKVCGNKPYKGTYAWRVDGWPAKNSSSDHSRIVPMPEGETVETVVERQTAREKAESEARDNARAELDARYMALYEAHKASIESATEFGEYKVFETTVNGKKVSYLVYVQVRKDWRGRDEYSIDASGFEYDLRYADSDNKDLGRSRSSKNVYGHTSLELAWGGLLNQI